METNQPLTALHPNQRTGSSQKNFAAYVEMYTFHLTVVKRWSNIYGIPMLLFLALVMRP
jgi:hypothetical protein